MKQTRITWAVLLLSTLTTLISCSKKDSLPPVVPPPAQTELLVAFGNGSIPTGIVDSVVAVFDRIDGLEKRVMKLGKAGSIYKLNLSGISAGQWKIEVTVHAQKGDYDRPRRYSLTKETRLPVSENINIVAPNGRINTSWNVRAVFTDNDLGITSIIAVNPADPYFEVIMRNNRLKYVYIDRLISQRVTGGYQEITGHEFEKFTDQGVLAYANFDHFRAFANTAKSSNWNRFETYLTVVDENNREHVVYYVYEQ
jgi:hypothetical protein